MRALPRLTGRFRRLYYALFVLSVSCACGSLGEAASPLSLVPRAILVGVHPYTPTEGAVFPLGLTDGCPAFNVPSLPRPAYMSTGTDPTFGTALMRIGGTVGTATAPVAGAW